MVPGNNGCFGGCPNTLAVQTKQHAKKKKKQKKKKKKEEKKKNKGGEQKANEGVNKERRT